MPKKWRCLVVGGSGFVGARVVDLLLQSEIDLALVRSLDLHPPSPAPTPSPASTCLYEHLIGSVLNKSELANAVCDIDIVVHCAALVSWGQHSYQALYDVNVVGTRNLLEAAKQANVKYFIFTSTVDVVIPKRTHLVNVSEEEVPYVPDSYEMYGLYAQTKKKAEAEVLAASTPNFQTIALRPAGIYGERDPYHAPNILEAAKSHQLMVRLGSPSLQFQHVYVDNVAHAHVCAIRCFLEGRRNLAAQAYFITDDTPAHNFWATFEPLIKDCGYRIAPSWLFIPGFIALGIAWFLVLIKFILSPILKFKPQLTPQAVDGVTHTQTFNGNKARATLSYTPIVSPSDAMQRTIEYFRRQMQENE
eukprot:m.67587 g.67587  ORF g.67587 m.67587 type:complete len:361 (-) comp19817_c0_seq4:101-1183(-)